MVKPKTYYRRNLPHYHPPAGTFHIVFRLAGTLPRDVVERLQSERDKQDNLIASFKNEKHKRDEWQAHRRAYFEKFDTLLDASSTGPRWLADARVADIVAEAIHYRDKKEYDLLAFTVMPNDVHMVITVERPDWSFYKPISEPPDSSILQPNRKSSTFLSDVLENLKWYTALKCNEVLRRSGQLWQHESYDHAVRDGEELEHTVWYVLDNPVRAGLEKTWEQWPWTYVKAGLV